MRVLVVGPRYEDSFADNVLCTLEDMGHEAQGARFVDRGRQFALARSVMRAIAHKLADGRPTATERTLLRSARAIKPRVILALTADIHPDILAELSLGGACRRILWWGDAPANSTRWGLANPHWDIVYVKDPVAVDKLRLIGTDARLMHEAMNPRWHRVLAQGGSDALVIFGNYYGYRQAIALRLLEGGVPLALYGTPPPAWSDERIRSMWRGKYISRDEKSRVVGEGIACLNTFSLAEGQSLNCRAFEIAGAGGVQLLEYRPIVAECFEPGKEILCFSTFDELLDHIARARRSPAEMMPIRRAAAKRALAEHTYRHRLERLLREAVS